MDDWSEPVRAVRCNRYIGACEPSVTVDRRFAIAVPQAIGGVFIGGFKSLFQELLGTLAHEITAETVPCISILDSTLKVNKVAVGRCYTVRTTVNGGRDGGQNASWLTIEPRAVDDGVLDAGHHRALQFIHRKRLSCTAGLLHQGARHIDVSTALFLQ